MTITQYFVEWSIGIQSNSRYGGLLFTRETIIEAKWKMFNHNFTNDVSGNTVKWQEALDLWIVEFDLATRGGCERH
jgi:hypothetical protein